MNLTLFRKLGFVVGLVTLAGSLLGMANQAEIAEPHWIATRSFVREATVRSVAKIERRLIATQIYLAKTERERLENEIANKQVLLSQNPSMSSSIREAINEQIRSLQTSLEEAKLSMNDLRRQAETGK